MYRALKFRFLGSPESFDLHRFKNFGEKIYVAFRDEGEVSIDEIDTTQEQFFVRRIHKRDARSAARRARKIAEKDQATDIVEIIEVDDEK